MAAALTPANIHLGAARIFAGVTPASSGTPPTYSSHTEGVPATGTEVGLTQEDCLFHYKAEQKMVQGEQALGNVQVFTIGEEAWIEFTCIEQTYFSLQQVFNNVGKETSGGNGFYFGGGTAITNPNTTCIMVTARQPKAPTKFITGQLYSCATMNGYEAGFNKKKETIYKVRMEALFVLTRTAGDQVGYYRIET